MLTSVTLKAKTRDAIVKIAHGIANGIDESFLFRDGVPLVFLVGGDPQSGKKIMPDETIEFFKQHYPFSKGATAQETETEGIKNYDEYHGLTTKGQQRLGVSFINVLWDEDYSDEFNDDDFYNSLDGMDEDDARTEIGKRLVDIHAAGDVIPGNGVAFLHNLERPNIAHDLKINFSQNAVPDDLADQEERTNWDHTAIHIEIDPNSAMATSTRFQASLRALHNTFG